MYNNAIKNEKGKTMKFEPTFNFYEAVPGIFLLEIDGNEDLAMTFLRAQEYYESVNDDFRGKQFTLEEYKAWYKTQSKTGEFSYAEDWKGFNLPSHVLEKCYKDNLEMLQTDDFLMSIANLCSAMAKKNNIDSYYLLGVRRGDTKVLEHEIAHGLYSTRPTYKKMMDDVIEAVEPSVRDKFYEALTEMGYGPNVHPDEMQAFLSTGLSKSLVGKGFEGLEAQFQKAFQSFIKGWSLGEPVIKKIKEQSNKAALKIGA